MTFAALLFPALAALAAEPAIPEALKACSKDADCVIATEGGCCGSYSAISLSEEKKWAERRAKDLGESCRGTGCPASVDVTPWTKVPSCVEGRCELREIRAEAECSRVPSLYQKDCLGVLTDKRTSGTCFGCLSDSCACAEDQIAFKWENYPESACKRNASDPGGVDYYVRGGAALLNKCDWRSMADKGKKVPLTTCFKRGEKLQRVARLWEACPSDIPSEKGKAVPVPARDSIDMISP